MRNALCVAEVAGRIVDNQVVGVDGLADRTVTQRAIINLLERRPAKPQHQQHPVGVGVVFTRRHGQVVIEIVLQGICTHILLQITVISVNPDFYRPISRQQLGSRIRLEPENGFEQERMANFRHAFNRRTVRRALQAGNLNLETQQLDALRAGLNPVLTAT